MFEYLMLLNNDTSANALYVLDVYHLYYNYVNKNKTLHP